MQCRENLAFRGACTVADRKLKLERPYFGIDELGKQIEDWEPRVGAAIVNGSKQE